MRTNNDYIQFLKYLEHEGINVEEHLKSFRSLTEKIGMIGGYFPDDNRIKFKREEEVFGVKVVGLVADCSPKSVPEYYQIYLAVPQNNSLGLSLMSIPYDENFINKIYDLAMKAVKA